MFRWLFSGLAVPGVLESLSERGKERELAGWQRLIND